LKRLEEFEKDLKRLLKKYRTLNEDLQIVRLDLTDEPGEHPPFSYRIEGLGITTLHHQSKKIACKAMKGKGVNSGLRLVYAWFEEEERIVFVEMYYKGDKEGRIGEDI
jgi:mRNA-degrading endonuclease RelE of RelBE toxin-antitoxin system